MLPVLIVWLSTRTKIKQDELRAQVLMEALRNNSDIDAKQIAESLAQSKTKQKTPIELLRGRLLRGCIFSLIGLTLILVAVLRCINDSFFNTQQITVGGICLSIGIAFFVVYFTSRRQVQQEYERELREK